MKIKIVVIGKSTPSFIHEGVDYYLKKIKYMATVDWIELVPKKKSESAEITQKIELEFFEKQIEEKDFVVLLDNNGKMLSSEQLTQQFQNWEHQNIKQLVLLIGGAFGFHQNLYQRSNFKLSLSPMVLSHQIVRLFLLEQIYRAYAIKNNLPYHNP